MSRCGLLRPQRSTIVRHWLFTGRKKTIVYWVAKLQPFFRIAVYFIEIAKIQ